MVGPVDADDVAADAFLAAMCAYPVLPPDSNVRAWLVTIARHQAIDHYRRTSRRPAPVEHLPEVPSSPDPPTTPDAELRAAVDALPPKQRAAVVYRYLADLPYAEVAALLDSTPAAARRSAADGIANLRKSYLSSRALTSRALSSRPDNASVTSGKGTTR